MDDDASGLQLWGLLRNERVLRSEGRVERERL